MTTENRGQLSEQLFQMYAGKFSELQKKIAIHKQPCPCCLSAPFLIDLIDSEEENRYEHSKCKLMIVGQQTNGWENEQKDLRSMCLQGDAATAVAVAVAVEKLMAHYRDFGLAIEPQKENVKRVANSPFWSFSHTLNKELNGENNKKAYVWANLWRMDEWCERANHAIPPNKDLKDMLVHDFNVLVEEIKILAPDLVVFVTGHGNDGDIKRMLGDDMTIDDIIIDDETDGKYLARLSVPLFPNVKFLRTYHPKYLRLKEKEEAVRNRIISEIGN